MLLRILDVRERGVDNTARGDEAVLASADVNVGVELKVLNLGHDEGRIMVDFDSHLRGVDAAAGLENVQKASFPELVEDFEMGKDEGTRLLLYELKVVPVEM